MDHFHALCQRDNCIGYTHTEIHVEVRFEPLVNAFFRFAHQILHSVRSEDAEGIDQSQRVPVTFVRHTRDQVQHPLHFGAAEVNRKEHHFEALRMRVGGGLDGKIDSLFELPTVSVLNDVGAGRNFHHDALYAAIDGALHIVNHAAGKRENLGAELAPDDFLDGGGIAGRYNRHAGFNAVHARFSQTFGDANLVVHGEDHAGLLLAIAQRDIMELDLLGEMKLLANRLLKIPRAHKPFIGLPG